MSSFRIDRDSLGQVEVPSDAYYGPFTTRAKELYKVTGHNAHPNLIRAYVMIKKSAALANKELEVLEKNISDAIVKASDEILENRFLDQFVIDSINSGAGTAVNMNCNEVIANRALEIIGKKKGDYGSIDPNDHVNMSQSSNDTFPTAMHLAIMANLRETLTSLEKLIQSLRNKSAEFQGIIKVGRTHLMDALPVTLKSEFDSYAYSLELTRKEIIQSTEDLLFVGLGGTAVGTGANTPKGYRQIVVKHLSEISGFDLKPSSNTYQFLQSRHHVARCSSALRNLAIELTKIANDIRLMASGPLTGLAEILIPAVHAGSSIMPGKVNPSLAECLNMICFNIIGNDVSVAMAAQAGQFELNVMLPGMLKCVLESTDMLKNFLPIFVSKMIDGLTANRTKLESYVDKSPTIVTLLNPYIGYMKAAEIYKESLRTNKSIKELVLNEGLMTKDDLDRALGKTRILEESSFDTR
jgi:aspartate ammonia-lyase